jgi:protein-tyrosine phosphatase
MFLTGFLLLCLFGTIHSIENKSSFFSLEEKTLIMRIQMVCLGNICRSPLAEGILKHKVKNAGLDWFVDSAGIGDWHAGDLPDKRSIAIAQRYNIDITDQRARQIRKDDLKNFDLILAMDDSNLRQIQLLAQNTHLAHAKIEMILNYVEPGKNRSVPDPYYGGMDGFEKVFQLLDEATDQILKKHQKNVEQE